MAGYFFDPTAAQRQAVSEFGNYLSESRRQDALKAQQDQQNQLIKMQLMEHAQKLAQAQQEQQNTAAFSQMAQQPVPTTRQVANPDFAALEQRITQAQNSGALDTSGTRMAYPLGSAENKLVQHGVQMPSPSDAAIEQIMQQYSASSPSSMMAQPLDERTIASAVLQQAQQAAMKHPSAYGREMVKQMSDEFYKRYPEPVQISPIPGVEGAYMAGKTPFVAPMVKERAEDKKMQFQATEAEKRRVFESDQTDKKLNAMLQGIDMRMSKADKTANSGKPLPATQLEALSDQKTMLETLKEAKDLMPMISTGPVAGRLQNIQSVTGIGGTPDPAFMQFTQKLSTVNNIMLKLRSGGAVTESEAMRFFKEMPTEKDPEAVRNSKMNGAINYLSKVMSGKLETYKEGGYKTPDVATSPKTPAKTNRPLPVFK